MERKIDVLVTRNSQLERPQADNTNTASTVNQHRANIHLNPINADISPNTMQSSPIPMHTYFAPSKFDFLHHPGELALSERHSTAPQHLLSWPCSALKLNKTELNYPVALEIKQTRLSKTICSPPFLHTMNHDNWLSHFSLHQLRQLTQLYFSHFHPPYLVVDETYFYSHHLVTAFRDEFPNGIDSVVSLLVLTLGATAATHTGAQDWASAEGEAGESQLSLSLFNLALKVFDQAGGVDWASVQCLLLMG